LKKDRRSEFCEIAKNEKSEILCCQAHTTVIPVGTDRVCGSLLTHTTVCPTSTTVRPVQAPRNSIFHIFKDPNAFLCVFRFLNNKDEKNFSSLSLVSKQFLSITNRLRFSITFKKEALLFLPLLFKRFTNLNTLNLKHFRDHRNLDNLLNQLTNFSLKLTSLKLPDGCYFPADGLSQLVTVLIFARTI